MTSLEKLNNSINALAETLFPEPYKGELGPLCDAAVAKIHELEHDIHIVSKWRDEGELLMESDRTASTILFKLGGWWADRPWRIK